MPIMPTILLFWISLIVIVYTYIIYPLIILTNVTLRPRRKKVIVDNFEPSISIVVAVFNEGVVLQEKLNNFKVMNYPSKKIELIIGSDGSDDRTNEILKNSTLTNLKVEIFGERNGKPFVLNNIIPKSKGDIIIFSDANTIFHIETIKHLVKHFSDPMIGGVCGDLRLITDPKAIGEIGEFSYWRYENFLKQLESDCQTLLGATGGVYAIRKELFKPLPTNRAIVDDFLIPMEVVKKGFRIVYEPEAIAYENSAGTVRGEFKRKVRIGASNFSSISEYANLLHPCHGFVAFALWSHKIIRWLVPFFLIFILLSSLSLVSHSEFFHIIFNVEIIFLLFALLGFVAELLKIKIGIMSLPYYFIAMNAALFIGFIKYVFGKQRSTWEIVR